MGAVRSVERIAQPADEPTGMQVLRCSTLDQLTSLAPYWDCLARGVPFRSWAWMSNWWRHYGGSPAEQRFRRAFGYSDRCRYYLTAPPVQESVRRLVANLSDRPLPATLLSQYAPAQLEAVARGEITATPPDLIRHRIDEVLSVYSRACGYR